MLWQQFVNQLTVYIADRSSDLVHLVATLVPRYLLGRCAYRFRLCQIDGFMVVKSFAGIAFVFSSQASAP